MSSPTVRATPTLRRAAMVAILAAVATLAWTGTSGAQDGGEFAVARLAGPERLENAVAISRSTYAQAPTIVLGRSDAYPDALGGSALAAALGGPLLLTEGDTLSASVAEEIRRLAPSRVVLLGGTAALSAGVEAAVRDLGVATVDRLAGEDRFVTAQEVALEVVRVTGARHAYLALGQHADPALGWADAVAVSALAAQTGRPILLTWTESLPERAAQALSTVGVDTVTIVGGAAVVSEGVATTLAGTGMAVHRLAGASRFETSLAVAEAALAEGADPSTLWVTTATTFADPLVTGPAAATHGGVMVLADGVEWADQPARIWVQQHADQLQRAFVVGDAAVMPPTVLSDLGETLGVSVQDQSPAAGAPDTAAPEAPGTAEPAPAPAQPPARSSNEVVLEVGDDLGAAVDAHPAGTSYRIAAGVHHAQAITPKAGDTFVGDAGAVLSGTQVLDPAAFTGSGVHWVLGGRTEEPFWHGETEPGFERDAAQHDLWAGDLRLRHVAARGDVDAADEWFFDYDADQVVLAVDPHTLPSLELAVAQAAFSSTAPDVTIAHVTVTRYASPAQFGAIHADGSRGWEVAHVTVSDNHGTGIRVADGMHLHHSRILRNGQLGVGGIGGSGLVVEYNEIAGNHTLGYSWGWEAGGTKFVLSTGMLFQHNWVHDNHGPGAWWDIDNVDAVIRSNLVEDNALIGLFYEISYGATISENVLRGNGHQGFGDIGSAIYVSNSRDVEIRDNLFEDNRMEIIAAQYDRGSGALGFYEVTGLHVHHNDLTVHDDFAPGLRVYEGDEALFTARDNRFESNTYRIAAGGELFWGASLDVAGWQAAGQDPDGVFLDDSARGGLPAGAEPFAAAGYGAV